MTYYPTNDRGLIDHSRDRAEADDGWEPPEWPSAHEIALDEFEAREIAQLEAEAEYRRRGWL